MRTGLHLGGGPGVMTGPDPAGQPPWAPLRPPPAPTGVLNASHAPRRARALLPPRGWPAGCQICGRQATPSCKIMQAEDFRIARPSASGRWCRRTGTVTVSRVCSAGSLRHAAAGRQCWPGGRPTGTPRMRRAGAILRSRWEYVGNPAWRRSVTTVRSARTAVPWCVGLTAQEGVTGFDFGS